MKKSILILSAIGLLLACQNKTEPTQEALAAQMAQIVAVHDELMPMMGTIGQLIGQLEDQYQGDSAQTAHLAVIGDLIAANERMTTWMIDLSEVFTGDQIMGQSTIPSEMKTQVAQFELSSQELKVQMISAIDQGKAVLAEL